MKNASKTMFNVGAIINIVYLGLGALLTVLGIILIIVGAVGGDEAILATGSSALGWGIYLLVAAILCFVFVGKARKELANENSQNLAPFIITIVFGAISSNPFYILAGIFGIIAESQERNAKAEQEPKQVEEQPKEE